MNKKSGTTKHSRSVPGTRTDLVAGDAQEYTDGLHTQHQSAIIFGCWSRRVKAKIAYSLQESNTEMSTAEVDSS
jgi:hypothetical protein